MSSGWTSWVRAAAAKLALAVGGVKKRWDNGTQDATEQRGTMHMKCAIMRMKLPVVLVMLLGLTRATQAGDPVKVGVYSETVNGVPLSYILFEKDIYYTSADGSTHWYPEFSASIGTDSDSGISFGYNWLEAVFGTKTIAVTIPSRLKLPDTLRWVGTCPVTSIAPHAFNQSWGIRSVTIPNSVTNIGDYAFNHCYDLQSVSIGTGVKSIGNYAFCCCEKLTSVTIPDSVTSIGTHVFSESDNLISIGVAAGNSAYSSVNGLLLTKDGKTLVEGRNGDVTIPAGVTSIRDYAFEHRGNLSSVTIPSSMTHIGYWAFLNFHGLLYIPSSWQGKMVGSSTWERHAGLSTNCTVVYYDSSIQTVTFDANGGNCTTTTQTYPVCGAYSNLPSATWTGHTFEGWWTAASGGTKVTAGSRVPVDSAKTLYAHWSADTYDITFDPQGGTGGTDSATVAYGSAMPAIVLPTRTNHVFVGYFTEANGEGMQYYTADGESARAWDWTCGATLYAYWKRVSYLLTLDRQDGTGGAASVTATYNRAMPDIAVPTKTDFAFGGYFTAPNGMGTQYYTAEGKSARTWDRTDEMTLYAKWTATNVSITPSFRNFGAKGGAYAIVTSGSGTWTSETGEDWITLNATSGQGGYPVAYVVGATAQAESRTGHVFVGGHVHTVTQDGRGATISPASATFEREGGAGAISVAVGDGVAWKAISDCGWIGVTPTNGTGPGRVTFTVSPLNEFTTRQGALTVAGQTFSVEQNGRWLEISPVSATLDCLAHTISVTVEAQDIAEWSVTSGANWISVMDAGSGKGNGEVTVAIGENPSWGPRMGSVEIGTATFTVTQSGQTSLEFAISPANTTASVQGTNGVIGVTATPDLPWSATSDSTWLSFIAQSSNGAGSGSVMYSVAPNPTLFDRTGKITVTPGDTNVTAKTHTVTQPAASSALSATGHEFAAAGGSCTVKVSVAAIVEWQIQNDVPWLTVQGATNRVGPATLTLKAAPTDMVQPRSGTVTIAGKPFTVTQAAAGALLTPAEYEFGVEGGSCEVWVSVPDVVEWQIQNTNSWLQVVGETNRVGPVPVTLQAVANTTVHSKNGTVTIADVAFPVSQKGRGVEVGYETKLFGADGGSDTISIHPEENVSWTAVVSDPTWITVFGSNSGTGDGEVMFIVSSFVGDETVRTGTITVGNKVVYITQRAYDVGISPKSASLAGESGTGEFGVSAGSGHAWQAMATEPWITLVEGNDSGEGNGTVKYRCTANDTGSAREGKIIVVGEVFMLQQQARPPFPEVQNSAEAATMLVGAADGRLGRQIQSVEEYEAFRAWVAEKGLDRQAVKDSPHAWISYALGAERLFGEEPTIQIDGMSVARGGAKGVENGVAMDVRVVVHDGTSEVSVDAGKVVRLFEATSDLLDWNGDSKLFATATQTGRDGATMQFQVVPGDGKVAEAFLRIGLFQYEDARHRQTISFASIGEHNWKDRVNLSALASSGGPVTFKVVSGPGKIEGNALSFTEPGVVMVQAMQTGNDIWLPATATQMVTVSKAEQTISFAPIGEQIPTDRVTLSAMASSGGNVTFEVVTGPGDIKENVLSFTGPGTVLVRAVQAGDSLWLPATATQNVRVPDANEALYMVVDLSAGSGEEAVWLVSYLAGMPTGGWTDEYKTTKLVLRRIEPGTFMMGSTIEDDDNPLHQVTLTKPYYMGVFEVTQKQYELVMGGNPSWHTGDKRPVEWVSWNTIRGNSRTYNWPNSTAVDANSFMGRLRARTGLEFDLPTEAQWEYACRAGTTSAYNNGGSTTNDLNQLGRYYDNQSDGKGGYTDAHTTVGSYLPNAWGLYDMHGNVWEWCLDWWEELTGGVTDPVGPSSGSTRVDRGGSWGSNANGCTSANRHGLPPSRESDNYGFRLVRTLPEEKVFQAIDFTPIAEQTAVDRVELSATATSGGAVSFEVVSGPGIVTGNVLTFTGEGTVEVRAVQAGDELWLPATATQTVAVFEERTYLVVDLSAGADAASYPVTSLDKPPSGGFNTDEYKTTKLVLRRIVPGTFMMGSSSESDNQPHQVTLTKPYYMGVFEVTQKQWELVTGSNPSYYTGDKRPVERVSWNRIRGNNSGTYNWPGNTAVDAYSFMGLLRARTGLEFDLPTEAQWEYACRAGTTSAYNNGGSTMNDLNQLGRYWSNRSDGKGGYTDAHTTVGSYLPNAWGLYDMHGNVWEWCLDWYGDLTGGVTDPVGPSSGSDRVARGGGCDVGPGSCASSYRNCRNPSNGRSYFGFRLVRTLSK